jgi:hypothetical protein
MSRFARVYEDPEYEDYVTDEDIYIEAGAVKPFSEWSPTAQDRLMKDVAGIQQSDEEEYSPYWGA